MNFAVLLCGDTESEAAKGLLGNLTEKQEKCINISKESINIFYFGGYNKIDENSPLVAVVFCDGEVPWDQQERAIAFAQERSLTIIPVVADLKSFNQLAPESLKEYNAFECASEMDIAELGNLILERFGLLRLQRKVFISYARGESRAIALQLCERLSARWYRVFLDTHSIRPGEKFQEALMQELADSDLMILLHSPGIQDRPWVQEEIAFATKIGIGFVTVAWNRGIKGIFSDPVVLEENAFLNADEPMDQWRLIDPVLQNVVNQVSVRRLDAYGKREENLRKRLVDFAGKKGFALVAYPGRFLKLSNSKWVDRYIEIAVGVPDAFRIQEAVDRSGYSEKGGYVPLFYDREGVAPRTLRHLAFLQDGLPSSVRQLPESRAVLRGLPFRLYDKNGDMSWI
ncbi:MAG: toll/interleukin-1 receptor domain-containing protein [Magnetococcales bacterium]|nr:toll/interleukin-1 receptor domain-containing protein [Magnetococcales bacterium]